MTTDTTKLLSQLDYIVMTMDTTKLQSQPDYIAMTTDMTKLLSQSDYILIVNSKNPSIVLNKDTEQLNKTK